MLAFTNTTHTKESAVALAKLHRTQDDYIRGTYGEATNDGGWKGCSVGCMAKGNHGDYPALFGIDTRVSYLSDRFFENIAGYKDWTVELFESIKEGSDTTIAYYKFMHWMLTDPEHGVTRFNNHKSINKVADLFFMASKGEVVTRKQWSDAYAAASAASAADAASAASAASAAYAAYAAYAASAASAAYAASRKSHYEIMSKKLCYFLAGN